MSGETDSPNYWLRLASETRVLSNDAGDDVIKKILDDIALGYERIAVVVASRRLSSYQRKE